MLNFGTVGSSWIADEYIGGAKDSGFWKLTAVYSRSQTKGEQYAEKHGAQYVFTDIEEMAESNVIDAVYIASPNVFHYNHCKTFLLKGKHVICEKPFCGQADKVQELQRLAEEKGLIILEAMMFMHLPQRKLLEDALSQIGEISFAKLDFCQRSSKLDDYLAGNLPNIFNRKMETGAFMDLGVYCVYPALFYFGKPDRFAAASQLLRGGADARGALTLSYSDESLVNITYSKTGQASVGSEFQGAKGTVYVESISRLAGITLLLADGTKKEIFADEEKHKLMGYEAADFYRYITSLEEYHEKYKICQSMSFSVSSFMEEARAKLGIVFDSDFKNKKM